MYLDATCRGKRRSKCSPTRASGELKFCRLPQISRKGEQKRANRIAYRHQIATSGENMPILWLGGYRSVMDGEKANALADRASIEGWDFFRFDYSGNGKSDGDFAEGNLTQWRFEAERMFAYLLNQQRERNEGAQKSRTPLIVGSSMGAWIALLVAEDYLQKYLKAKLNLLLIAPAVDFTHHILPQRYPAELWAQLAEKGVIYQEAYGENQPLYYQFVQDAKKHLILNDRMFKGLANAQVRISILHGSQDEVIPLAHGKRIAEHLQKLCNNGEVNFQVVQQGDHRLSRKEDIAKIIHIIEGFFGGN